MKNTIKYYYNFDNISILKNKNTIYIKSNNKIYIFCRIINENETMEIYSLTKNLPSIYKFVLNKEGTIFTNYQNFPYVLLEVTTEAKWPKNTKIYNTNKKYLLDRSNWYELWSKKIDYFEYQNRHIFGKYKIIDECINYYIGLSENAISYISYLKPNTVEKYLCHKRISKDGYLNPLNLVIDYRERDMSEYLKYIFLTGEYKKMDVEKIIAMAKSYKLDYSLIFGRLLFPSHFFDLYDQIVNNKESEEKLKSLVKRINEYEEYLKDIYKIILKYENIKKVDWL